MAKVHPKTLMIGDYTSSKTEIFTVWMKSLVFNGNGCTVFNSQGHLLFRLDNYQTRCSSSNQVLLMNFSGQILFSIKRKERLFWRSWEGHKWINSSICKGEWFKVKRECRVCGRGKIDCNVIVGCNDRTAKYKICGLRRKWRLQIMDCEGGVLAEVVEKQSLSGSYLGDDVLSLMVEPQIDQSLVMALVVAYAMINNKF